MNAQIPFFYRVVFGNSFDWNRRKQFFLRTVPNTLRVIGRVVCWLRGHHAEKEDFGGGADVVRCKICDRAKLLRIYGYDQPDDIYENPKWT